MSPRWPLQKPARRHTHAARPEHRRRCSGIHSHLLSKGVKGDCSPGKARVAGTRQQEMTGVAKKRLCWGQEGLGFGLCAGFGFWNPHVPSPHLPPHRGRAQKGAAGHSEVCRILFLRSWPWGAPMSWAAWALVVVAQTKKHGSRQCQCQQGRCLPGMRQTSFNSRHPYMVPGTLPGVIPEHH